MVSNTGGYSVPVELVESTDINLWHDKHEIKMVYLNKSGLRLYRK